MVCNRDLIQKLLEVDPAKRITPCEIMTHPWFTVNMPLGLEEMNTRLAAFSDDELTANCPLTEEAVLEILERVRKVQHWPA